MWQTISELSRRLGRPESTIRSWRDRYRAFVPERTDTAGRRIYPVDVLAEIQALQGQHLTPREIRAQLARREGEPDAEAVHGPPDRLDQILAELLAIRVVVEWLAERERARAE
jgi:DNA-binding transcriptional MerR regulator